MSKLRSRMTRDMQLAGLVEGTRREYLRAVRQLAAYYMISPDQLSERNVEGCLFPRSTPSRWLYASPVRETKSVFSR
jgi:Phage integrase, N-terminal SAM-like domain